jgi:hypothetical protein
MYKDAIGCKLKQRMVGIVGWLVACRWPLWRWRLAVPAWLWLALVRLSRIFVVLVVALARATARSESLAQALVVYARQGSTTAINWSATRGSSRIEHAQKPQP